MDERPMDAASHWADNPSMSRRNWKQWAKVWALYGLAVLGSITCSAPKGGGVLAPMEMVPREIATSDMGGRRRPLGLDRTIPAKPPEWQKRPPCNPRTAEFELNGGCWVATALRPPCGDLYRHPAPKGSGLSGDLCWRPVEAAPRPPTTLER